MRCRRRRVPGSNPGGTPAVALAASIALALLLSASNTFNTVLAMLAFLFVVNYALTFSTLFVLRRRSPLRRGRHGCRAIHGGRELRSPARWASSSPR